MYELTVVGLGPGDLSYMTQQALAALKSADKVLLRTARHPVVDELAALGIPFESYDDYYERGDTFDDVYAAIADDIVERLADGAVVYAVPGNPFVAERTVELLAERHRGDVRYVHGSSFIDAVITALGIDPVGGMRIVNSLDLKPFEQLNDDVLVCIQCYDAVVASELKIWLSRVFLDEHPVVVVQSAGIAARQKIVEMPLYELDRYAHFDHLTSVIVKPQRQLMRYQVAGLLNIVAELRSENGCPWDREQDHLSLKQNLLEEAYEVAETLENEDIFGLEEELGDLLLQVVFHAQIARENGDFDMTDVTDGISQKLVRRHPHVFGDLALADSDAVIDNWEKIKRAEKQHETTGDVIKKYSKALPALFRCHEVIKKAAKAGAAWPTGEAALAHLQQSVERLAEAIKRGDAANYEQLLGAVYLAACGVARRVEVASELSLHKAVDGYVARFSELERRYLEQKSDLKSLDVATIRKVWQKS